MSLFKVFDIAGSAMSAQSVRLNTTASNLANANTVSGTAEEAYQSHQPVFRLLQVGDGKDPASAGVRVAAVVESQAPPDKIYQPDHPQADDEGYIFKPSVNTVEELVNMISAQRSYQNNVEILSTSRELIMRTLAMGQR